MIAASCLLALLLAACATVTIEQTQIANVRRVAIISALGDRFTVKKLGFTVFGNDERDFPVDAWGIDDAVAATVRGVVGKRFDVRPLTYQRSAFFVSSNDGRAVADAVRSQFPAAQDIDAFIVVTKGSSAIGDSNAFVSGLGLLEGDTLLMHTTNVYALYWITVVDAHRFAVIGNMSAWSGGQSLSAMSAVHGPNRDVDQSLRPTTLEASSNSKLREVLLDLLQQNLPGTLQRLKILD
jgi:hypothetical protein